MSGFRKFTVVVQEGSWYTLLFLLPFSKAAIEIGFGILFIAWLIERGHPDTRAQTVWASPALRPLLGAVGAFLLACALSIPWSSHPSLSLQGFINKWVEYLLFFVILADLGSRPGVVTRSLAVLACSSLLVVLDGISQERVGMAWFRGTRLDYFSRMTGPYENPIDLATYLIVVIPILLGFSIRSGIFKRACLWGLLLALTACLARTQSLGAWLGLWIGLVVAMSTDVTMRRFGLTLLMVSAVVGGAFLWQRGNWQTKFSLSDIGKMDRLMMWQAALGMIRDRPLLGLGLNTFMANYLTYWVGGERQPRYAHNCYLQMAAETGVIGFVTFVWLLGSFFAHCMASLRRLPPETRLILCGFVGGLFAFVVQAGVDTNFYSLRQSGLFWTLAGLAVGYTVQTQSAQPAIPARPKDKQPRGFGSGPS